MYSKSKEPELATLLVRGGECPDPLTGALAPVLIRSKTYKQPEFGKKAQWEYARGQNPTRSSLEKKLVALEGGGLATVFASGLAAETMLFLTLSPGDNILIPYEVYGGTLRLLNKVFATYGISYTQIDFSSEKEIAKAITSKTKYIFVETLTNPSLHVIDLSLVQKVSEKTNVPFIADMTFSPPCSTRAFEYGAYAIVHSISKYISGHNDVLGGAIITRDEALHERLKLLQRTVGAVLSPDECYRAIQGSKTLHLRWEYVSKSALEVAHYLKQHKKVARVLYPGLPSHPSYHIAQKQMKNGYGGVLSFELAPLEDESMLKAFVDSVQVRNTISYGESLASPETLLAYPCTMSHGSLSEQEKEVCGISKRFFRLSLGFESPRDIITDLERGLQLFS
jgi:cystathionine beta-lyase/cystathionine gamma-synthase